MQEATAGKSTVPCHYCHQEIPVGDVTLDHKVARARDIKLYFDKSNLVFACELCNYDKGSMGYEEYLEKISRSKSA